MIYRYVIKIYGIVQGVGFRPYVYNLAIKNSVKGWVSNEGSSLVIDIEGSREKIRKVLLAIVKNPPTMAKIKRIKGKRQEVVSYSNFIIKESEISEDSEKYLLGDIAICGDCLEEINNENSIWYNYPFTSCTNCGPRYSIMNTFPYDRDTTNMEEFVMCERCREMYKAPKNRRFHAQTISCPNCGPIITVTNNKGDVIKCKDEIQYTRELIKCGKILVIKGIGGFHLCCNAFDNMAVEKLRNRKNRPHKPFALMMKDIDTVKQYVEVSYIEEELLKSPAAPIVLLKVKKDKPIRKISENVAPKMKYLGIMLPYTPLHHLLFKEGVECLVMTSGNISGGTVEYNNAKALDNLSHIGDYFLIHNRNINIPIDDSVAKVIKDKVVISRIGRGYAPYYIDLDIEKNILALGSEMKNTFALSSNEVALLSQYTGDLKNFGVYEEYIHSINNMKKLLNYEPNYVVVDKHPGFIYRGYKQKNLTKVLEVQHHFAHMASSMVEHHINHEVIGVIYDGVGYGDDGQLWGGEFFIGDRKNYQRVCQYKYIKIQGGDKATEKIYKIALSFIEEIQHKEIKGYAMEEVRKYLKENLQEKEIEVRLKNHKLSLENNVNCYRTSSVGRIFDAVASILGIRQEISYDGQGAIELEMLVVKGIKESYNYSVFEEKGFRYIDILPAIEGIIMDKRSGVSVEITATKFHNTLINITVDMVKIISSATGLYSVVLSGGVFENRYLLENITNKLEDESFKVYFNEKIPINDSGISVGQLAMAKEIIEG